LEEIVTENKLDFSNLEKAITTLATAVSAYEAKKDSAMPDERDLMRDGVIQRFEYTFELAWKTIKRYLEMYGLERVDKLTSRDLFRVGFEAGLIGDASAWFEYLADRNQTSHIYDDVVAAEVYDSVKAFLIDVRFLLVQLKERVK
jgi:nucleotidyltransferase substrate binding protein (TIGR01987 family)